MRKTAMTDPAIALPAGTGALRQEDARRHEGLGRMSETGRPGAETHALSAAREDPDQPLLARLAKGDERAYAVLVQRHLS